MRKFSAGAVTVYRRWRRHTLATKVLGLLSNDDDATETAVLPG